MTKERICRVFSVTLYTKDKLAESVNEYLARGYELDAKPMVIHSHGSESLVLFQFVRDIEVEVPFTPIPFVPDV